MGTKILVVIIGGGLGSGVRYLASLLGWRLFGPGFPAATLAVNVAGCLLIGVAFALAETRGTMSPLTRLLLMTGFLGGLTTFSTFALETVDYAQASSVGVAALNILVTNAGGLAAVLVGMWVGRVL
jgi:fluoride exporter